jgi:type I restriction enzyme M protein
MTTTPATSVPAERPPTQAAPHSAQELSRLIKAARKIMRKDKGLSGDVDRIPILTWVMFLKFLDDLEAIREQEALLARETYRQLFEPPYRWRDWAAKSSGTTGDELIAFINNDEAVRPDGTRGPGLFAYLRTLEGTTEGDRRDVVATVFRGMTNRMANGYLLRDVINLVNGIHFESSEEVHTLSHLYESLVKEMRDAAGDSGEFYTPRPVVRFMTEAVQPRLGEVVLDPACGTGGFLVEAFKHLQKQAETVEDRTTLQSNSILGGEPKPLPYLLVQMNLLLHELEAPKIDPENSLRFPLREIGDRDRVDVILTNPPFGGEEERGILANFPADKQTSETALLFLQLIMRKLRRTPKPGRAGVVVPDGILSGDGVAARIKEDLLRDFTLHTIVRLPDGVFSPYTTIPTNIVFFERGGPTTEIWYYEIPLPEDFKQYTKTKPLKYEEFEDCLGWWHAREENEHAWKVSAEDIAADSYNLDVRNPSRLAEDVSVPLSDRQATLIDGGNSVTRRISEFAGLPAWSIDSDQVMWRQVVLGDALEENGELEELEPDRSYGLLGVALEGRGPFLRETKLGQEIGATALKRVAAGSFIYSRLFAWRGAFGLVPENLDGTYVSNEFPTYLVDENYVFAQYLRLYFMRPTVWREVERKSQGTTKASRNRFKQRFLKEMVISVPDREIQEAIVAFAGRAHEVAATTAALGEQLRESPRHVMASLYRGDL